MAAQPGFGIELQESLKAKRIADPTKSPQLESPGRRGIHTFISGGDRQARRDPTTPTPRFPLEGAPRAGDAEIESLFCECRGWDCVGGGCDIEGIPIPVVRLRVYFVLVGMMVKVACGVNSQRPNEKVPAFVPTHAIKLPLGPRKSAFGAQLAAGVTESWTNHIVVDPVTAAEKDKNFCRIQ